MRGGESTLTIPALDYIGQSPYLEYIGDGPRDQIYGVIAQIAKSKGLGLDEYLGNAPERGTRAENMEKFVRDLSEKYGQAGASDAYNRLVGDVAAQTGLTPKEVNKGIVVISGERGNLLDELMLVASGDPQAVARFEKMQGYYDKAFPEGAVKDGWEGVLEKVFANISAEAQFMDASTAGRTVVGGNEAGTGASEAGRPWLQDLGIGPRPEYQAMVGQVESLQTFKRRIASI